MPITPTDVWDAERIKALRQFCGITQSRMAFVLNAEQKTISRWETGQRKPRGHSLRLLTLLAERVGFVYVPEVKGN